MLRRRLDARRAAVLAAGRLEDALRAVEEATTQVRMRLGCDSDATRIDSDATRIDSDRLGWCPGPFVPAQRRADGGGAEGGAVEAVPCRLSLGRRERGRPGQAADGGDVIRRGRDRP